MYSSVPHSEPKLESMVNLDASDIAETRDVARMRLK